MRWQRSLEEKAAATTSEPTKYIDDEGRALLSPVAGGDGYVAREWADVIARGRNPRTSGSYHHGDYSRGVGCEDSCYLWELRMDANKGVSLGAVGGWNVACGALNARYETTRRY